MKMESGIHALSVRELVASLSSLDPEAEVVVNVSKASRTGDGTWTPGERGLRVRDVGERTVDGRYCKCCDYIILEGSHPGRTGREKVVVVTVLV